MFISWPLLGVLFMIFGMAVFALAFVAGMRIGLLNAMRSLRVKNGLSAETLVPTSKVWKWHPRDARHIGTPIDYVVFNGLEDGSGKLEIIFVEVKTGRSRESKRELQVRAAVLANRVSYEVVRVS